MIGQASLAMVKSRNLRPTVARVPRTAKYCKIVYDLVYQSGAQQVWITTWPPGQLASTLVTKTLPNRVMSALRPAGQGPSLALIKI